jgi:hypothetical protein
VSRRNFSAFRPVEQLDAHQRGSGGKGVSVAKRNIVVERNSCPGFSSVVEKLGLLGLSGKCCVSRVNPSVRRYVVSDDPTTEPFMPLLV